jgi:tryptophan synthase alpha chain
LSEAATAAGSIAARWGWLRARERRAFIPYVTAGFPSREATVTALRMLADEGADFMEVGVPFSDPLADGATIQRSSHEALRGGMTLGGTLEIVREARLEIPVVLFSYVNPILSYGVERFVADARGAGCAGVLLTDLPVGEDPAVEAAVAAGGLDRIPLVAVTTAADRLAATAAGGRGFMYLIARLGVTGARTDVSGRLAATARALRAVTRLPIAVGFGITRGTDAAAVARFADGVVVGSALVERLGHGLDAARDLAREIRSALDGPAGEPG